MKYRTLGKTGFNISEVSLGCWQLGSKWGEPFNMDNAINTLEEAYKNGINFFDTADCYQNGLSEKAIGQFIKTKNTKIYVSTKIGRRSNPHVASSYTKDSIINYINDSINNLDVKSLDLVLLHCPPTDVFYKKDIFDTLDELKKEGKIQNYGVSVERIEEGIKALDYDISAVEIIYNMFRQKPDDLFFNLAKEKNVGIIVRVPLASGLLTGKYDKFTQFGKSDHRTTNRNGERFDKGETFAGIDYNLGLEAVSKLKEVFGDDLAKYALKWILMNDKVSTIIPGASSPYQIENNTKSSNIEDLTKEQMDYVKDIYNKYIKQTVHYLW